MVCPITLLKNLYKYQRQAIIVTMANYRDWNKALVSYFSSDVLGATRVYLSVDDQVLERIGLGATTELKCLLYKCYSS